MGLVMVGDGGGCGRVGGGHRSWWVVVGGDDG